MLSVRYWLILYNTNLIKGLPGSDCMAFKHVLPYYGKLTCYFSWSAIAFLHWISSTQTYYPRCDGNLIPIVCGVNFCGWMAQFYMGIVLYCIILLDFVARPRVWGYLWKQKSVLANCKPHLFPLPDSASYWSATKERAGARWLAPSPASNESLSWSEKTRFLINVVNHVIFCISSYTIYDSCLCTCRYYSSDVIILYSYTSIQLYHSLLTLSIVGTLINNAC